jgi:N-acetylmuramoyl-L-alanine amidase CwlD
LKKMGWIAGIIVAGSIVCFIFWKQFFSETVWNTWNLPLTGRIIYLDPGHGGPDGGAKRGNAVEKTIALDIAKKLQVYLEQQGALVLLTREGDTDLADDGTRGLRRRKVEDLRRRMEMINESEADLFVSIHLNSIPSSRWRGAQTFYGTRFIESRVAAELIQEELIHTLKNTDRKAKPQNNLYLLKTIRKPGVLVEVGFLSNPEERQLLLDEEYQEKIALAITYGISRYFTEEREERVRMLENH